MQIDNQLRSAPKPHERQMRLPTNSETKVVQFKEDSTTACLAAGARKRWAEITGRKVSGSVIHKASIAVFARFLNNPVTSAELRALLR